MRKLSSAPAGLADLLAELLEVKGTRDWGDAMKYDRLEHTRGRHHETGRESPVDFTGESIERRLGYGYGQMCEYLDSQPSATSG